MAEEEAEGGEEREAKPTEGAKPLPPSEIIVNLRECQVFCFKIGRIVCYHCQNPSTILYSKISLAEEELGSYGSYVNVVNIDVFRKMQVDVAELENKLRTEFDKKICAP